MGYKSLENIPLYYKYMYKNRLAPWKLNSDSIIITSAMEHIFF